MQSPLEFRDVTFRYRFGQTALSSFSHKFSTDSCLLLGPNGAGKSTLLALAASALLPQSGDVICGSYNTRKHRDRLLLRRDIGWLPQQTYVYPGLSVREQLQYSAWLKKVPRDEVDDRVEWAQGAVHLSSFGERRVTDLSGGEIRRVGLAQALVHRPKMLLLDEPTAGLDPLETLSLISVLADLPEEIFILLATHSIGQFLSIFPSVLVMDRSTIYFSGTMSDFNSGHSDPTHAYAALVGEAAAEKM